MSSAEVQQRRRGITIHPASEAVTLEETDFMAAPTLSAEAAQGLTGMVQAGLVAGGSVEVALRQTPEEGGFSLVRAWFKPNYPLMRHSHDADCLYYVLSGEAVMGNRSLRTGDTFFVPADAPYRYTAGPDGVEVLEIRHGVDNFDMKIYDEPEGRWAAMADAARDNRDRWESLTDSPTHRANQGV